MAVATASSIVTQLKAGTYPSDTLNDDNILDFPQYDRRRKYPSCEVEVVQPEGTEETKQSTITTFGFNVKYFVRNLGIRTDEVASQKTVEDIIISQIEAMTIQDHKVVLESKIWRREQVQRTKDHPAYTISVLAVTVRQVTPTTATADGTLKFILANSTVDSPPGADYLYTSVYDVDIQEGYRDIPEQANNNPDGLHTPHHYAGAFSGRFIGNIPVKAADLGTTGDKLNKLMTVRTVGEKPIVEFEYTNKTNDGTPSTITETIELELDSLSRLYIHNNNVIYRIIATIRKPSTIVVT